MPVDKTLSSYYSDMYNIPIEVQTRKTPKFTARANPDKLIFVTSNDFDFMHPVTPEEIDSARRFGNFVKKTVAEFAKYYTDRAEAVVALITAADLKAMTAAWSSKIGLPLPYKVSVTQLGKAWGLFRRDPNTSAGTIVYNKDLLFMPKELAEYVVVHELAHAVEWLRIRAEFYSRPDQATFVWNHREHHGGDFWRIVSKYMPDWAARKKDLNDRYRQIYKMPAPEDG